MAKMRKVTVVRGYGSFIDPHHVQVEETTGSAQDKTGKTQTIRFKQCIIAAGSQAMRLPFLPDDPRIVDSTGALELRAVPKRMLIVGGGIIGLEMGTVYSTLGARLDVVEMLDGLMQGADRDLVKVWQKMNAPRFDHIMLNTKTVGAKATADGILVNFEGESAPKEPQLYDLVLQAVGRSPNGKKIGADKAGVAVSERGFIPVDQQMRTNVAHIFAIGDVVGQPMLAHKAVHEAHVAAEVASGDSKALFDARVIPSVAYTDPEVAWVGLTEDEAKAQGLKVKRGAVSRGRPRAAPSPTAATKVSPSCCSTIRPRPTAAFRPSASSARMPANMIGQGGAGHRDGRRTRWTSARPSIRTPRWARVSAWRPRWRMGRAPICRRRASEYERVGSNDRSHPAGASSSDTGAIRAGRTRGCAEQFRVTACAQLTCRGSLRDIERCLRSTRSSCANAPLIALHSDKQIST